VADWYTHKIRIVDTNKFIVVGETMVGDSPSGLAVTPDGKLLLSADRDSDSVSIVDVASRRVLASIHVGKRPFGITIDGRGERAYTANVKSDDATVIDIAARKVVGSVKTGRRPYAVALAGGRGFVTDQYGGTVTVFDLATLALVERINTCDHAEGIETDARKLTVTGKAPVADGPRAFGKFLR
jgi:YVTN family beta-propeller protein